MRPGIILLGLLSCTVIGLGQFGEPAPDRAHPAIQYADGELHDPVAELNRKLADGSLQLKFDKAFGYLPALASELGVPAASQLMVFSKTSLQSMLISPANPRAILFNDSVAIAFVRGSPTLEVLAQDPRQGSIFYTLDQSRQTQPILLRESVCLGCHATPSSLSVPGPVIRTVFPSDSGAEVRGLIGAESDHRTPFAERWGGWYVTGKRAPGGHRANAVVANVRSNSEYEATSPNASPLLEKFATTGYLSPYSDVVALTVFEHQAHMMNLITRLGWEARVATSQDKLRAPAKEFVDYLLFVDEAPWTGPIEGTSGFAAEFSSRGPFDRKGRALRQFDLKTRLMRYPCSYMIYSDAFQVLPAEAKAAVYARTWAILSGEDKDQKYNRLSAADRKAVIEILRDTLKDLPDYFKPTP